MHAVPFIPAISFKLAERERFFYVDADRFTRTPLPLFFLFPRVIIQIRKLLARPLPPPRFVYRSLLQIHFVSARFVQLKLKKTAIRLTGCCAPEGSRIHTRIISVSLLRTSFPRNVCVNLSNEFWKGWFLPRGFNQTRLIFLFFLK